MAEQWIESLEQHANGHHDMLALREHYQGKGNASRCIALAEHMRENLLYKNERSLAFSIFFDRMQKMFNMYEEEGEEFNENSKLPQLFKRVQHPQLQDTIKALKVRFDMEGLTYTQAANHLMAAVSELTEYHMMCKVSSAVTTRICGGGGGSAHKQLGKKINAPKKGIYMPDGTIFTSFYLNWKELDKEEQQQVVDMHKKKKNKSNNVASNKCGISEIETLTEAIHAMKQSVSELISNKLSTAVEVDDGPKDNEPKKDARNSFGGHRIKFTLPE